MALLNSALTRLSLEMLSRIMIGDITAIDVDVYNVENLLVPNPKLFNQKDTNNLEDVLDSIANRRVDSLFEEFKKQDRKKLDLLILKKLELQN